MSKYFEGTVFAPNTSRLLGVNSANPGLRVRKVEGTGQYAKYGDVLFFQRVYAQDGETLDQARSRIVERLEHIHMLLKQVKGLRVRFPINATSIHTYGIGQGEARQLRSEERITTNLNGLVLQHPVTKTWVPLDRIEEVVKAKQAYDGAVPAQATLGQAAQARAQVSTAQAAPAAEIPPFEPNGDEAVAEALNTLFKQD